MKLKRIGALAGLAAAGLIIFALLFFFGGNSLDKSELGNDDDSFRVALVVTGNKDDSPLALSAYEGILSQKQELDVYLSLRENVAAADYEFVLRSYALEGYELIYACGDSFKTAVTALAGDFPDVAFVVLDSKAANNENVGSIALDYRAMGYIKGTLAAYLSRNGIVAGIGVARDQATTEELTGFQKGVFSVDPNIQVHADFSSNLGTGKTAADLAGVYLGYGADVVSSVAGASDDLVIVAAEEKGAYVLAGNTGLFEKYPQTVIAGFQIDLPRTVADVTKMVYDKKFKGENALVDYTFAYNPALKARVPAQVEVKVKAVIDKIVKGELKMDELVPME